MTMINNFPISKHIKKISIWLVFLVYLTIILRLTIFRTALLDERQINLSLFIDLINIYRNAGLTPFIRLFFGNIAWFIPFGFFLPMIIKRNHFLIIILAGFLFSLVIETSQFVFYKGVAELDDLILNTSGVAIGYLLFMRARFFKI